MMHDSVLLNILGIAGYLHAIDQNIISAAEFSINSKAFQSITHRLNKYFEVQAFDVLSLENVLLKSKVEIWICTV